MYSASQIDYKNMEEVCGYQLLLSKIYEREGGFAYPRITNAAIREVQREGRVWLREVKFLINDLLTSPINSQLPANNLSTLSGLIISYDFLHRICHGTPCDVYLREVRLKTVDRWLKGDKSISKTDIVLMLLSETDRDIHSLDRRYSKYALTIMKKWIEELTKYGRFVSTPLSETYKRLAYLLKTDLFVYLGRKDQARIKARWVREYTLTNEQINALETNTLWDYIAFSNVVSHIDNLSISEQDARYSYLLTLLSSRTDLHPYSKKAIEIDLQLIPSDLAS